MSRISLLGVPIDAITGSQAIAKMKEFLSDGQQHHVMTPNSEMLVEASKNESFKKLLQESSLNLPDSIGLVWMARVTGQKIPERVTGVDTVQALCAQLDERQPVFFLGAAEGVASRAASQLEIENWKLEISGCYSGNPDPKYDQEICDRINSSGTTILFVAFGAPKQDEWIARNLDRIPSVKLAMGVGGTFDFLAGVQKRAPVWMQTIGLEWLWRLIKEPKRIMRIWNAVVVFPWLVLFSTKKTI